MPGLANGSTLQLRVHDGLTIVVPPSLSAITTYVLLEQEDWFEKEINFLRRFLKPGMTAIDIGANLGVYSLAVARLVGPSGRVFAYEPGGEARAMLEQSRALNGLGNLEIVGAAVSDCAREGNLAFAASSELRALAAGGQGERVHITSLDIESAAHGWSSPDFIKIDAEGEEERIIAGGAAFFAEHSPLIMFEINAGDKVNERLRALFPAIGYRLYRQLGGAPILVPDDALLPLDSYELNLFAAKPDRATALSHQGFLVDSILDWQPSEAARQAAMADWRRQVFASAFNSTDRFADADTDYLDALAAYSAWRNPAETAVSRCAALAFALRGLQALCAVAPTVERLSTFARVASDWGARATGVTALQNLFQILQSSPADIREPFWPASPRFDTIAPSQAPIEWFAGSAAEQHERAASFSSAFSGASQFLPWLCSHPFASSEMERRHILSAARDGQRPAVPARLSQLAPDHLNAEVWRTGKVPGTICRF